MRRDDQVGHVAARSPRARGSRRSSRRRGSSRATRPRVIHRDHGVERGLEHRARAATRSRAPRPRRGGARRTARPGCRSTRIVSSSCVVGLAQLAREELHHADARRAGCAAGSRTPRAGRRAARRPRAGSSVLGRVDDPRSARRDASTRPGRPSPAREREPLAQRLELGRAVAGVPRADAAQPLVVGPDLPDRAELPAERAADRLEHAA